MQRIRVGLTGLAFVFLLVMLATAFLQMADGSDAGIAAAPAAENATAPSEPLAQLGVAPGNVQPATSAAAATPVPTKPVAPAR